MNFHVLTLFPEMIEQGLNTSILGKSHGSRIYLAHRHQYP